MNTTNEEKFCALLEEELVPALGCTEPIAIAFAGAKAREVLGAMPDKVELYCSNNIVKNVKSVTVPFTNGMKGMDVACTLGVVAGDANLILEVLNNVKEEDIVRTRELVDAGFCKTHSLESTATLDIIVKAMRGEDSVEVEVKNAHGNVVKIVKNGELILNRDDYQTHSSDFEYSLNDILDFVDTVDIGKVEEVIMRQIDSNMAIANEGLRNDYGQRIGKTLLKNYGNSVEVRARAYAAAGSDARMNGCTMPVIINSGSGNQGITVSVPIYIFAEYYKKTREELIRAVLLSNLCSIHIKHGIGKLSAFCGAVSASCGVAAGITYIMGGNRRQVAGAISNTIANVSGIVCDGAKASCAAKISSSVDAGIMAYYMAMDNNAFGGGDGIIDSNIEITIDNVGKLGKDGMRETDNEIISIMLGESC